MTTILCWPAVKHSLRPYYDVGSNRVTMIFRPLRIDYHSRAQECLALEQSNRIATFRVFPQDESRNDDTTCDYSVNQNEGNNANDGGSSSRDGGIRDANNKGPTTNRQKMIDTASQVRTKS